jgi:adenylate cyclase class 1
LPGYVAGDVPHGIWSFVANEAQQAFIQDLCQNANCQGGLSTHDKSIQGLYSMGSTSSIGQCCHSDLDIWVCHVAGLSSERLALLEQKCQHLSMWAEQRGVDLNFFLIPEDKFRQRNDAQMQGELRQRPAPAAARRVLPQRHAHRRQAAALVSGAGRI